MQPVSLSTDSVFLESKLKDLKLVTLYLLSTGRNAWHNTWSEKYRPDTALFSSFEAAKAAAEDSRNRGTTFEIEQFSGIAFYSSEGVVALVEFHSKQPFKKLKLNKLENHLRIGTSIREAIAPFIRATSEYWEFPYPSESSFVGVKSDLSENFEKIIELPHLKKWGSVSAGSKYYLIWREKGQPEAEPISRIAKLFTEINEADEIEKGQKELSDLRRIAIEKANSKAAEFRLEEEVHTAILEYFDELSAETTKDLEQ